MWTVQVDDTVGGWIVTTYPHPLSQHDTRPVSEGGDPSKQGEIIAECHSLDDAKLIARLLNEYEAIRLLNLHEAAMQERSLRELQAGCMRPRPGESPGRCVCGQHIVEREGRGFRHVVALQDL